MDTPTPKKCYAINSPHPTCDQPYYADNLLGHPCCEEHFKQSNVTLVKIKAFAIVHGEEDPFPNVRITM